jgi:hypothetical protein
LLNSNAPRIKRREFNHAGNPGAVTDVRNCRQAKSATVRPQAGRSSPRRLRRAGFEGIAGNIPKVDARSPPGSTRDRPLPNSYWVIPGRLLAGEYPGDPDRAQARQRLLRLREAGIASFVDLTEEDELPPYSFLLPKQAEYLRCPIVDTGVPNNVSQTRQVLAAIHDALARDRGLYVHCRAGIGRTGLIIGCFLADQESSGRSALKTLNRLWRQSERAASWPKIPQTAEQADYIRRWPKLGGLPGS